MPEPWMKAAERIGSECDWGNCSDPSVTVRFDAAGREWLPVCREHRQTRAWYTAAPSESRSTRETRGSDRQEEAPLAISASPGAAPTDALIERAASALWDAECEGSTDPEQLSEQDALTQVQYRRYASAVISAVRSFASTPTAPKEAQ